MEGSLYNRLKEELGYSDAINEYIEVLLREYERHPHNEASFQDAAAVFGIQVNNVPAATVLARVRGSYIVSVYQVFENYLARMENFLKDYGNYRNKEDGESALKHVHACLLGMQKTSSDAYVYYLICDYYRLIRNLCAHVDNEKKVTQAYEKLSDRREQIRVLFPKLQAPNPYQTITFDDFILYSRAAKALAQLYQAHMCYDPVKLACSVDWKKYRGYKTNPERARKAIRQELRVKFPIKPEDAEHVADHIMQMAADYFGPGSSNG